MVTDWGLCFTPTAIASLEYRMGHLLITLFDLNPHITNTMADNDLVSDSWNQGISSHYDMVLWNIPASPAMCAMADSYQIEILNSSSMQGIDRIGTRYYKRLPW